MALLLPMLGFLCGLGLASFSFAQQLKTIFASLLSRALIPYVIIYNMVFYQAGSLSLILFSFGSAVLMFYLFRAILQDQLRALCVSYLNLAWLGFPFALALFGPSISAAMVALYVGGSIFGNIWAVLAFESNTQGYRNLVKKVLLSPPAISLAIAALCRVIGIHHLDNHQLLDTLYWIAKVSMTFTGMCVLGIWLRHTCVGWSDLVRSSRVYSMRMVLGLLICGLSYYLLPIPNIDAVIGVMFLLFLLPPAVNIVALETHYLGTGVSTRYIASGTIISCVLILCYGVILRLL